MKVSDYMTREVITALPGDSFLEARRKMRQSRIRRLPVVDEEGRLVGLVTERDLGRVLLPESTRLDLWDLLEYADQLTVARAMTRNLVTIGPDAPIEDAATLLRDDKIGALPVVENGKVVGIVTDSDIFDALNDLVRRLKKGGEM